MTDLRNLHDEMMRCVEEGLSLRQTALRLGLTLRVITKVSEWYGFRSEERRVGKEC